MKTTFWIVVAAKRAYWDSTRVHSLTAHTIRQKKPALKPDEIAVRVTLDVDLAAFSEPVYSTEASLPAAMAVPGPAIIIEEPPVEELEEVTG